MMARKANDRALRQRYTINSIDILAFGDSGSGGDRFLLFFVVQFVTLPLEWRGGRAFYKFGSMSRALFASSGNGYARLKRCAGDLSKILSLLESPSGEFDCGQTRGRVSALKPTARDQAGRFKVPNRARAPIHWRNSNLPLSPPWNAAAGPFFKCGDLLQSVANVSVVTMAGAIVAPPSSIFVGV